MTSSDLRAHYESPGFERLLPSTTPCGVLPLASVGPVKAKRSLESQTPPLQARQPTDMVMAEFEEKQFECAFNNELYLGGPVFPSGQVLESITGYDSSADPGPHHVLWRVLSTPRPKTVRLVPSHWASASTPLVPSAAKLPQHPVSLVLQFKRPEYLQGSGAAQYHFWNQPYFRFTRSKAQHSTLRKLEQHLLGSAVVRYASPAFHRYAELEQAQLQGDVVESTGFVSPIRLGRHATWTYVSPGTVGRGNPDGEEIPFAIFDALFTTVGPNTRGELAPVGGIRDHLALLAEACRQVAPVRSRRVDAWISDVGQAAEVPADVLDPLSDYAVVQSLMAALGASWSLLDGDVRAPVLP